MTVRRITIDAGQALPVEIVLKTQASPAELLTSIERLGYLAVPADTFSRQAGAVESQAEAVTSSTPLLIPAARIVMIA